MFPLGTVCSMIRYDMKSMKIYSDLRKKFPYLICPCKITPSMRFVLESYFDGSYSVISLEQDRTKKAIVKNTDLKKV